MEVILKEEVKKVGKPGEVVKVADGYARNFLFPQEKAIPVTAKNLKSIQEELKRRAIKTEAKNDKLKGAAGNINGKEVTIKKLAHEDNNKLFGSVSEAEIAGALKAAGYEVEKSNIVTGKHIKELGTFDVTVRFKGDIEAVIKVNVIKDTEQK
jgi:large subunit ribosomal protein L9